MWGPWGRKELNLGLVFAVQVLTLLFGVYDNSKILSHTLHQLACHPCAQKAAREEVDAAWGGRPPNTLQALISLRYLHACLQVRTVHERPMLYLAISLPYHSTDFRGFLLHGGTACRRDAACLVVAHIHMQIWEKTKRKRQSQSIQIIVMWTSLMHDVQETLRMSAGRGVIWRVLEQDVMLGKHVLPRNATLVAPTASIHSNPEYWPEPGRFKPGRFLEADSGTGVTCFLAGLHVYIPDLQHGPFACELSGA